MSQVYTALVASVFGFNAPCWGCSFGMTALGNTECDVTICSHSGHGNQKALDCATYRTPLSKDRPHLATTTIYFPGMEGQACRQSLGVQIRTRKPFWLNIPPSEPRMWRSIVVVGVHCHPARLLSLCTDSNFPGVRNGIGLGWRGWWHQGVVRGLGLGQAAGGCLAGSNDHKSCGSLNLALALIFGFFFWLILIGTPVSPTCITGCFSWVQFVN